MPLFCFTFHPSALVWIVIAAFPIAIVLGWRYYLTADGLVRTLAAGTAFDVTDHHRAQGGFTDMKIWWRPSMSSFRRDRRFAELAERQGVATYCCEFGWPD